MTFTSMLRFLVLNLSRCDVITVDIESTPANLNTHTHTHTHTNTNTFPNLCVFVCVSHVVTH